MSVQGLVDAQPTGRAAIALSRGGIGIHLGIIYRGADQIPRVLHLAWHCQLRCDDGDEMQEWAFVPGVIDEIELQVLAGFCTTVKSLKPRIPYGFRYESSRFDDTGRFIPGGSDSGLTCSTFVMALFELAGIPLLGRGSWEERAEDKEAHLTLLAYLKQSNATEQHIKAVEAEVGCIRFRSEEVAGSSCVLHRPVEFEDGKIRGRRIKNLYEAWEERAQQA